MKTSLTSLPSLNGLRSFVVAAQHLSLTQAGVELGVTPGAVGRLIKTLETELGVSLVVRSGKALTLTPAGAALYPMLARGFELLVEATCSLYEADDATIIRMNVLPTWASAWLIPRLSRFQARHPQLQLDLKTQEGVVHFERANVDLAVIRASEPPNTVWSKKLMPEVFGLYCSPTLKLDLQSPLSFTKKILLHTITRPEIWPEFFRIHNITVTGKKKLYFEHFFLVVEAALAGLGVAILPTYVVADEVRKGMLIQASSFLLDLHEAYYLIGRPGATPTKNLAMIDWLLAEIADDTSSERTTA